MSLFTSFNAGVSGIVNAQAGLNTTGHNLANTKTPGYTRQQNINTDTYYQTLRVTDKSTLQIGYGTTVATVRQIRDIFMDKEYRLEVGRQSFYEEQYNTAVEIEDIFGEMEGVEFEDALTSMWATVESLSTNPESITNRELFIAQAEAFLQKAQDINQSLRNYQINLNEQITEQVARINEIADEISALNVKIASAEASGLENANDYRDARNLLMDELATYTTFDAYEDYTGRVTIRINNAPLVDDLNSYHMQCEKIQLKEPQLNADGTFQRNPDGSIIYNVIGSSPMLTVTWKDSGYGEVYSIDRAFSTENDSHVGSLLGILTARGTKFGYYTDIPQNVQDLVGQQKLDVLNEYNNSTGKCLIERVEAQLDLLIHKVVTAINDAFAPNISTNLSGVTGTDAQGTVLNLSNAKVLDINRCPVGTDDADTPGTEVFSRKSTERYHIYTVTGPVYATDDNGARIKDEDGNDILLTKEEIQADGSSVYKLYVYNDEDKEDVDTQYTIQNLEINAKLLSNYSYLPVHGNPEAGKAEEYERAVYENMLAAWREESVVLDPNSLSKFGADEFYDSLVGSLGTQGSVWKSIVDNQTRLVESIEDKRQQVSGVSTEEEMVSLLMYQHAYNAASRYITTIDSMLEHLIERLG